MTVLTATRTAPFAPMALAQIRAQLLALWRVPAFSGTSLIFPAMFYGFFGVPNAQSSIAGTNGATYLLASFAAYGVISVMLFSFGLGLSNERGQRMHVLQRATPLPGAVYLGARTIVALLFSLLVLIPLSVTAVTLGNVPADPWLFARLASSLLAGSLPFALLGFAIGYLASPNAAPAIVNLTFFPIAFASGLLVPLRNLPEFVQSIAPFLPAYYYGQVAWSSVGATGVPLATSALWLAGYGLVFGLLALWAYRREADKEFG